MPTKKKKQTAEGMKFTERKTEQHVNLKQFAPKGRVVLHSRAFDPPAFKPYRNVSRLDYLRYVVAEHFAAVPHFNVKRGRSFRR